MKIKILRIRQYLFRKLRTDILELSYSWCVRWTENSEEVVRFYWAPQVTCSSGSRARSAKPWIRGFESHRDLLISVV